MATDDNFFDIPPEDDDDELDFNWLDDDDESGDSLRSDSEHTGVTGELYWQKLMGEDDDDSPRATDDDDNFDWQDANDDADSDDDDVINDATPINRDRLDVGKLQRQQNFEESFGATLDAAEEAEFGDTGELLDWMSEMPDETDEDSAPPPLPATDMPDWMAGMPLPDVDDDDDDDWLDAADGFGDDQTSRMNPKAQADDGGEDLSWLDTADGFGDDQTRRMSPKAQADDGDEDLSWLDDAHDLEGVSADDFASEDSADDDHGSDEFIDDDTGSDEFVDDDEEEVSFDEVLNKLTTAEVRAITEEQEASWLPSTGELNLDDASWLPSTGELKTNDDSWLPSTGELDTDDDSWLPSTGELKTDDDSWLPSTGELDTDDDSWLPDGQADIDAVDTEFDSDEFDSDEFADDEFADDEFADDEFDTDEDDRETVSAGMPDWLAQMKPSELDATAEDSGDATFDIDALFPEGEVIDGDDDALDELLALEDEDVATHPEALDSEPDTAGELDDAFSAIDAMMLDAVDDPEDTAVDDVGFGADFDDDLDDDDDDMAWLGALDGDDVYEPVDEPVDESLEDSAVYDDDFAMMGVDIPDDDANTGADWFDDDDAIDAEPDWLSSIDELALDATDDALMASDADADLDALLADVDAGGDDIDLDDLLAELDEDPSEAAFDGEDDLDALLADYAESDFKPDDEFGIESTDLSSILDDITSEDADDALQQAGFPADADIPDWLREIAADADDETSAAALLRQRKGRPDEELDDRLLALRDRGLNIQSSTGTLRDTSSDVLPAKAAGLAPASIEIGDTALGGELVLDKDQRKQAKVLDELVNLRALAFNAVDTAEELDAHYDGDAMESVDPRRRRVRRLRTQRDTSLGRWLVAVLLLVAVLAPFLSSDVRLGNAAPAVFAPSSAQSDAFIRIQALQPDAYVLVAVEYSGAGAGELDTLTQALLTHIARRGAYPILVSTKPIGLLRGDTIARDIWGADNANVRYSTSRYLVGDTLGLRNLVDSPRNILGVDYRGNATGITLNSLDDLALVVLISDSAETVRGYMEQIVPQTQARWVVASSYSATPLVQPYIISVPSVVGALRGFEDGATYTRMLLDMSDNGIEVIVPEVTEDVETPEATPTVLPPTATTMPPTATQTGIEATAEVEASVDAETEATATNIVTTEVPATEVPPTQVSPTQVPPTQVPPTSAPTRAPTTIPPTNTPRPTQAPLIRVGTVNVSSAVNVRAGAGTNFAVVTALNPNVQVRIIGEANANDGALWYEIALPDGTEGWVASFLMDVEEVAEGDVRWHGRDIASQTTRQTFGRVVPAVRQADAEATPEVEATAEATETESVAPATTINTDVTTAQLETIDARYQAMTTGLVVAILLIFLANMFYIVRVVVQRDR